MKRLLLLALTAVAALLAAAATAAPPPVQATAYLVVDGATGEPLAARNQARPVPIASITKLMTVLVALDSADPDDVVTVTGAAADVGESTIHLRAGERLTVDDLIEAALIQSANDAATALAEHVGRGSVERFVGLMNEKARALGLRDTEFRNPSGLDAPGHVSSARDVTRLARVAMESPYVRAIVARQRSEIAGGRTLSTWNDLLGTFPSTLGVKTGHTNGAGWSQVAAARGGPGVTVYATILGGPTRAQRNEDLSRLLAWGLAQYRAVLAVDDDRTYATAVTGYDLEPVGLVATRDVARIVRTGRPVVEHVVSPVAVELPVRVGQRLGEVRVTAGGKTIAVSPLVADRAVGEPSLAHKVRWYAGRAASNLWSLVTPS